MSAETAEMHSETSHQQPGPGSEYAAELPERVLGVSTKQVLAIGETAIKMNAVVPEARAALPEALGVLAVIERVHDGSKNPTSEDQPAATPMEATKISSETAYEKIAKLEKEAKLLARFENPRGQFLAELDIIAQKAETAIGEHRDYRVRNKIVAETPAGPGIKGFLTKVFRKGKRFLGFLAGRPAVNPNITAYDAAAGLDKTARSLLKNAEQTKKRLPLLSGLVFNRLSSSNMPPLDKLAFLAPEILTSLFAPLKPDSRRDTLLKKVEANPHEFRFVTKIGFLKSLTTYKGVSLEYLQAKSRTFLPAVRDIIPTNGPLIGGMYDMANHFMNHDNQKPAEDGSDDIEEEEVSEPKSESKKEKSQHRSQASKVSKRLWKKLISRARTMRRS